MDQIRVVVPFAEPALHLKEVLRALRPLKVEIAKMYQDDSYYEYLKRCWSDEESFVLIEQDIKASPEVIQSLADCVRPWCGVAYEYVRAPNVGLGCMKFGRSLLRSTTPWETVGAMSDHIHPPKHWCALDARLQAVLRGKGYRLCQHVDVTVEHLGFDGHSTHGCL